MRLLTADHDGHFDDGQEYVYDSDNLDEGDGEVVRGGVEPLNGGDHAAVVDCAQELRLVIMMNSKVVMVLRMMIISLISIEDLQ